MKLSHISFSGRCNTSHAKKSLGEVSQYTYKTPKKKSMRQARKPKVLKQKKINISKITTQN